jgi:hypothetical protein
MQPDDDAMKHTVSSRFAMFLVKKIIYSIEIRRDVVTEKIVRDKQPKFEWLACPIRFHFSTDL